MFGITGLNVEKRGILGHKLLCHYQRSLCHSLQGSGWYWAWTFRKLNFNATFAKENFASPPWFVFHHSCQLKQKENS